MVQPDRGDPSAPAPQQERGGVLGRPGVVHRDATDPAALDRLNAALARVPVQLAFTADAHHLAAARDAPFDHALARLVDAVRRCDANGAWRRLKACDRDTCRWAYYDASRNQARRWCSMAGCGNWVKMRRAYATRTGRRGAVDPDAGAAD
ncbi:CGNR zinc finger domain-containing protein [Micromonospora siamensis]|uniref:CGNR zinc finger domain-containing protein n=1 Tax=Micromonospora siamensis TaxID=299152 RepID=UPI001E5444AC|nr:CGNR zinc finger domain-containing protein [Micromonospora siamensis]